MSKKGKANTRIGGDISVGGSVSGAGVAIGHGARITIDQGVQGDELTVLVNSLRQAVQEAELSPEKKQQAAADVKSIGEELSKPKPNGGLINETLVQLATIGGSVAVAAMQLAQSPALQSLIQKFLGK